MCNSRTLFNGHRVIEPLARDLQLGSEVGGFQSRLPEALGLLVPSCSCYGAMGGLVPVLAASLGYFIKRKKKKSLVGEMRIF